MVKLIALCDDYVLGALVVPLDMEHGAAFELLEKFHTLKWFKIEATNL